MKYDLSYQDLLENSYKLDPLLKKILLKLINFPNGQVCKHYATLIVLNEFYESKGIPDDVIKPLAKAIIDSDDKTALELLKNL